MNFKSKKLWQYIRYGSPLRLKVKILPFVSGLVCVVSPFGWGFTHPPLPFANLCFSAVFYLSTAVYALNIAYLWFRDNASTLLKVFMISSNFVGALSVIVLGLGSLTLQLTSAHHQKSYHQFSLTVTLGVLFMSTAAGYMLWLKRRKKLWPDGLASLACIGAMLLIWVSTILFTALVFIYPFSLNDFAAAIGALSIVIICPVVIILFVVVDWGYRKKGWSERKTKIIFWLPVAVVCFMLLGSKLLMMPTPKAIFERELKQEMPSEIEHMSYQQELDGEYTQHQLFFEAPSSVGQRIIERTIAGFDMQQTADLTWRGTGIRTLLMATSNDGIYAIKFHRTWYY